MREARMATNLIPESGERLNESGRSKELEGVASRVVALAHLACAMHMHEATVGAADPVAPNIGEGAA